ncbi:MAG: haloacid dehalogenase-like hydrolase [Bacteroidaceae bacterium]|nr:haloacid dehalogenase-like hydrolase [Bacteroidaceae bacterium]
MICFDFDNTITSGGTFWRMLLCSGGWRGFLVNCLKESFSLTLYAFGLREKGRVREQLMETFFRGWHEEKFGALCEFTANRYGHLLRPEMIQRIENAIEQEEKVLIITDSFEPLVRAFLPKYDQIEVIATELDTYNGMLSGRFRSPYCVGVEKVRRLLSLYPDRKEYRLVVYGDSKDDADILDFADDGHWAREVSISLLSRFRVVAKR